MVGLNMDGATKDSVLNLIEEKKKIEDGIREQMLVLDANDKVGMHGPLVDAEGYPRNDIDVYKVRQARHQMICLVNDHKAIMKRIEEGLAEVHSQLKGPNGEGSSSHMNGNGSNHLNGHSAQAADDGQVFAKVSYVLDGSPADDAGLCSGDEVLQFGTIDRHNFADMSQVHNVVAHSVGQRVQVKVRRDNSVLSLAVVPRLWAQPGLLGCQINRIA